MQTMLTVNYYFEICCQIISVVITHAWVSYIGFTEAYNDATKTAVNPMSKANILQLPGGEYQLFHLYSLFIFFDIRILRPIFTIFRYLMPVQLTVESHQVHLLLRLP